MLWLIDYAFEIIATPIEPTIMPGILENNFNPQLNEVLDL